jgi:electron transfer flavoprotein alpha/beta subunit
VLGAALRKIGFDLVICGGLSDDGTTGAVPGALAEDLGVPGIANVRHIESAQGALKVQCETDNGYQVVNGPLPALISVTMAVGEPRYPSLKGIMGAKKKPITSFTVAELDVADAAGAAHAKTELLSFSPPQARGKGQVVTPDDAPARRASSSSTISRKESSSDAQTSSSSSNSAAGTRARSPSSSRPRPVRSPTCSAARPTPIVLGNGAPGAGRAA